MTAVHFWGRPIVLLLLESVFDVADIRHMRSLRIPSINDLNRAAVYLKFRKKLLGVGR